ncbi:isoleucine--tRNA ligase [Lewinellaceae bacterium SD302]|nr:isoleucine--tRNA ligase [Lewinellaceae bacterium SD302]
MYQPTKSLNLPEIDKEILEFWEREKIFERSITERDANNNFVFYEGPPSANGKPGIHHVMARAIKDIFCRFQTLQGKRVERKGGWDTHGLPIELSVEKELGITKEDIGTKISVDDYNKACRETVMRYKDIWDDITRKMGYWVDLENPYITYENEYIESVWWLLKQIYDKGLIYKGYTIQPYSPAAGTGLSSHELNMPGAYQDVTDTTVVAMFEVEQNEAAEWLFQLEQFIRNEEGEVASKVAVPKSTNLHFIAWTTTPWTLPSNTALTVGPKIEYVKVRTKNQYTGDVNDVVLARELVDKWFGGHNQPTVEAISKTFTGKELDGLRYEQLLKGPVPTDGDAFRVITGNFVTTDAGTGIVHTAPSFGQDDMAVGKANGIGSLTLVDKQGKFTDEVEKFGGRYVKDYKNEEGYKDVNVDIAIHLKTIGQAFNVAKYNHNYPHCWRTDKPVLYYPLDSWFIKASAVKERMSELNETINWKPASTGTGRFGKWLENLNDWNLSRSRYWGIPLPIWRSEDGEEQLCIGSIEELKQGIEAANEALGLKQEVPGDLHRPYIDDVVLYQNGKKLVRELDLIDVWFDSGSMPYAQWHYPFENKEKFAASYPADFIAEGVDQTRGWFYTLHAIGTMVFDSVAYKNVVSNGLVLDKNGKKMSKRLGNAADPFETIGKYGADATRWYMIGASDPWENLKFDIDGIGEVQRRFFGTLYNTYGFYALYANIDQYAPEKQGAIPHAELAEIDQWIISKLNSLTRDVTAFYADYEPTKAVRAIDGFVNEELSNWYVRQNRRRFWKGDMTADKQAAYQTLYYCLERVAQLMSPVAPFFADWLYRNLTRGTASDSVHLSLLPTADESLIDEDLEQRMSYAQRLSSLALSLRKRDKIRVRQPLQKIMVPALDADFARRVEAIKDIVLAEVNVKELELLNADDGFLKKQIKPNFRSLGRKLGKNMKAGAGQITSMSQEDIATLESKGEFPLNIDGSEFLITPEDVEVTTQDIPGWKVANDNELTLALDVDITPELAAEGMARELVNRIQNVRKDQNFEVTDRIIVQLQSEDAAVAEAVNRYAEYIKEEVLANTLDLESAKATDAVDLVDGSSAGIEVKRA